MCCPNPFNIAITFNINQEDNINLRKSELNIYNIKGQKIRKLKVENNVLGIQEIKWDGKDVYGNEVGAGVYLIKIKGENTYVGKVVKITSP